MKKLVSKIVIFLIASVLLCGCGKAATEVAESVEATENQVTEEETTEEVATEEVVTETAKETEEENETEVAEKTQAEDEKSAEESNEPIEVEEEKVPEFSVTPYDDPKTMYATIALNVRKGPSTDYDVIGHLAFAQAAEITGVADTGWYQMMLNGEEAYVSHRYMAETEPTPAPVQQAAQPAPTTPAAPTASVAPAGVIMVGDSRCVQMQAAVGGGGCSWVCENSKEYTWFVETAIPKFDQYVGNGTKVVINMGVNDPEHYRQYAETINAKAAEWAARGARTYLVSVNPVWENPYTSQEQVDTFNANVPGMLSGVTWIDTSTWLNTNGYRVLDGLHYDDPTYVNIFNLIMGSL